MAVINTAAFAKALEPGVNAWFGKSYNEFPVQYTNLFDTQKTKRAWIEDVGVTGLGLAKRVAEGAPIEYEGERQGFVQRYEPYQNGLGFIITEIMIEDDLYNIVAERRAKALAFSVRQTKEIDAANVYNRAFSGSYTYADGVSMINASHPNVSGGTQSNLVSGDMNEITLEQAIIDMSNWTNDKGLRIAVMPKSLIIPAALEFEAARLLRSDGRVGTGDNDINALKSMGKFQSGVIVNNYLTDDDAWFIRTVVPEGLKYIERRPDTFAMEDDFDTGNIKFKVTNRYDFGITDWKAIQGCPGT